jgi:hypothetical protein
MMMVTGCTHSHLASLFLLLLAVSEVATFGLPSKRCDAQCKLVAWKYQPSKLELLWRNNINEWGEDDYCINVQRFGENITYWLEANARLMLTDRPRLREHRQTTAPPGSVQHGQHDVFSAFVRNYTCCGATYTRTAWIEPLAFSLRHPLAPCNETLLVDRTYMLLGSQPAARLPGPAPPGPRRFFMFDMGASTFSQGFGGPSQSFLVEAYKRRGIVFDRILLWEATPHNGTAVFDQVPRELHAAYQYINIPVSAERGDPGNPLEILKAITTTDDFVAVKLDIDTPLIENELVQQVLEDTGIWSRIDEFYFEQHVNFKPMRVYWGGDIETGMTLATSYELFSQLRQRGVRAHGWP